MITIMTLNEIQQNPNISHLQPGKWMSIVERHNMMKKSNLTTGKITSQKVSHFILLPLAFSFSLHEGNKAKTK